MASPDLAAAIATLLNDDQERILALASGLRAPNRTIESRVQGTSMGPGLAPGMRIRIDMSPRDHYPLGGVVAFVGGNRLIVHRLVHQGAEYVLTRGDARLAPDAPVKREQIVGLVTAAGNQGEWRDVVTPRARKGIAHACAAVTLLAARILLRASPAMTACLMRAMHVVEGRAHEISARLHTAPR